ncbi:MAG TPA: hypothetical protein VHR47_12510 [Bacillota bacterium]|jgi:hypothetical protein|nr:hypothetical protein [Bacillota bacterium]
MPRAKAKERTQLKLSLDWTLMAEVERKEESPEVFEASSQAFRGNIQKKNELPLWNALMAQE